MMLLRLVRAFVPIATFWVGKLILDTVIAVRDHHAALPRRSGDTSRSSSASC